MPDEQRRPPQPMGETLRGLGRSARSIGARGDGGDSGDSQPPDRQARIGRVLVIVGVALGVVAIIGAIAVNVF